jgi:hypothetical protein
MFTSQIGASDNIGTGCQVDLESRKLRQDSLTTDQYLGWLVMQCMETPRPPKFSLVVFLGLFSISLFVGCATMDAVRKAALADRGESRARGESVAVERNRQARWVVVKFFAW